MDFNEQITKAVSESVQEAFKAQLSLDAKEASGAFTLSSNAIAGWANFTGEMAGNIVLGVSTEDTMKIAAKLLGKEIKEVTPEAIEPINKLMAAVLTGVQTRLKDAKADFTLAALTMAQGETVKTAPKEEEVVFVKHFTCDLGQLGMRVTWKMAKAAEPAKAEGPPKAAEAPKAAHAADPAAQAPAAEQKPTEPQAAPPPAPEPKPAEPKAADPADAPPKLAEEIAKQETTVSLSELLKESGKENPSPEAKGVTSRDILSQLDSAEGPPPLKEEPSLAVPPISEPAAAIKPRVFLTDAMRQLDEVLKKYKQVK